MTNIEDEGNNGKPSKEAKKLKGNGCRFSFTFNEINLLCRLEEVIFYRLFFLKTASPLRLKITITAKVTIRV